MRTPLDIPLGLLTIAATISALAAGYMKGDWLYAFPRLFIFWCGLFLYQILVRINRRPKTIIMSWGGYVLAGLMVALVILFSSELPQKIPFLNNLALSIPAVLVPLPNAESGIHPNQAAGTLLWFLPFPAALAWKYKKDAGLFSSRSWIPWFIGICGFFILSMFILLQSRAAYLGAILASLALLAGRNSQAAIRNIAILIVVLAIGILGTVTIAEQQHLEVLDTDTWQFIADNTGTLEPEFRLTLWAAGLHSIADFPYTGMGLGMFREYGPLLYSFPDRPEDVAHAHHMFIHSGAEMGFLGLISHLLLWIGLWRLIASRLHWPGIYKPILQAALWSLIAFTIFGLFDTIALGAKSSIVLWVYLGLVVITRPDETPGNR